MKLSGKIFGLVLAGLVLLPGCMPIPRYKKTSLKVINNYTYRSVQENVVLQAKRLNKAAEYMLFGDRIQRIADYKIICLSIHNLSKYPYRLSSNCIGVNQAGSKEIATLLKTNTVSGLPGTLGGLGIVGASIGASYYSFERIMYLAIFGGSNIAGALSLSGFFMSIPLGIGGLVMMGKSIKSWVMNRRIDQDIQEKIVSENIIISSGDKYEGLIFVKSDDNEPQFRIALTEQYRPDSRIIFDVDLRTLLPIGVQNE